jgi:NAD+ diphosphatase
MLAIPREEITALGLATEVSFYLGTLGDEPCYAVGVPQDVEPPEAHSFEALRPLFGQIADDEFGVAGRAMQVVEWDRTHRFCGRCGAQTEQAPNERAKVCPDCALTSFPRLSPAVIVRVRRGEEILLAHGTRFPAAFYSVLAGFVEPGESLEDTIQREIREEVGIEVDEIRYFGSQPWPFPNSLMIGFTATYAGGELVPDPEEIEDAGWFSVESLPLLPPSVSIARWLIDDFVTEVRGDRAATN